MTSEDSLRSDSASMRPMVARRSSNAPLWVFGGIAALGATALFAALESKRAEFVTPATAVPATQSANSISSPPELVIPPDFARQAEVDDDQSTQPPSWDGAPFVLRRSNVSGMAAAPSSLPRTQPRQQGLPASVPEMPSSSAPTSGQRRAEVVYEAPINRQPQRDADGETKDGPERVKATFFENPATTLPKGAIVQAVLETALDSTRAGPARAIVARDVRGFDGSRILIPRGSRLYGEYKADLAAGQKRAMIQWQRLMRPDGAIINLNAPSADPLGRAGVGGKVDSHFFERFGGAILQSALDIGVALASRQIADGTIIVGFPGGTQSLIMPDPNSVKPTLRVNHGTPISVFVSRDLDFTEVER